MSSTDLITYLNYISTWETESDANIDQLIFEQMLFIKLDNFESDSVIDNEFNTLINLAKEVRDTTIDADFTQIAADAAAVASIWSFGLGMAAFVAFETEEAIERGIISSKSTELNNKLTTIDTDISSQINENVKNYVSKYKGNNNLIISKAPKGLDTITCRGILMQFMAEVQRKSGKLDAATFREYAESARIVYNSDEIEKVYDALDKLNMSGKSEADVQKFFDVLHGLKLPETAKYGLTLVYGISIAIMSYKLKIANKTISECAKAADIPLEEVESSAFGMMDAVGKFTTVVAVILSVVDIVLDIIDIVKVVDQCNRMCDELNTTIKDSYKSFFNGLRAASKAYKAAINLPSYSPLANFETNYIKGEQTLSFTYTKEDESAIRQAALDYIESQHAANRAQMERCIHPRLMKRTFWTHGPTQHQYLREMSGEELCLTAESYNKNGSQFPPNPKKEVEILDICGSLASVKLTADKWIDYMHIIKLNGEWKIVNVLWAFNDVEKHK